MIFPPLRDDSSAPLDVKPDEPDMFSVVENTIVKAL